MNTLLTIPEERTRTPRRHESTTKPPAPLSSGRLSRLRAGCSPRCEEIVSTPSARVDRQEPLPMFRRPGSPGFP